MSSRANIYVQIKSCETVRGPGWRLLHKSNNGKMIGI